MCSSIDKDIEFCDAYMDISQNEKRIVRASVKTYEITGSYISIKLFKQDDNKELKFNQKVTLTLTKKRMKKLHLNSKTKWEVQ